LRKSLGIEPWNFGWKEKESNKQNRSENISYFSKILMRAKTTVESWNGRFVIGYLPWKGRYFNKPNDKVDTPINRTFSHSPSAMAVS
jgi:hypothetical protein